MDRRNLWQGRLVVGTSMIGIQRWRRPNRRSGSLSAYAGGDEQIWLSDHLGSWRVTASIPIQGVQDRPRTVQAMSETRSTCCDRRVDLELSRRAARQDVPRQLDRRSPRPSFGSARTWGEGVADLRGKRVATTAGTTAHVFSTMRCARQDDGRRYRSGQHADAGRVNSFHCRNVPRWCSGAFHIARA